VCAVTLTEVRRAFIGVLPETAPYGLCVGIAEMTIEWWLGRGESSPHGKWLS